jgi:hypothetical protein
MHELGFLGGEHVRESTGLDDEVVVSYDAVGSRPRTAASREALHRHAISVHGRESERTVRAAELATAAIERAGVSCRRIYQSPVRSTACVTRIANAEGSCQ